MQISRIHLSSILLVIAAGLGTRAVYADPGSLVVHVDRPGHNISQMLYGLMTEEINHSYDGGIYAELIQNRCFKDNPSMPVHWNLVETGGASGSMELDHADHPGDALTVSLKLHADKASGSASVGAANSGYWGVPVKPNTRYRASLFLKPDAGFTGRVTLAIETADGSHVFGSASITPAAGIWKQYTANIKTGTLKPSTDNRFVVYLSQPGTVWLTQVSLFPPTYNNRPNGNRIDLMERLAAMKPAFLRLPGGNYLEGDTFNERFAWKNTIGDISQRPGHRSPWNYRSSDGLGLLEYLEWCEDLKMQPILAVFAGYSLRGQHVDAGPELKPYVDEALDEIEYVTGDTSTKWGAVRAQNGHPAPFKLEYVEIGNEDAFDRSRSYDGRYTQFFDAIRAKYPTLKVIATMPVRTRIPDVVDDHYYRSAADMERDAHHYDNYPRTGPKIFVGEWASTEGSPTPTLQAALGDAAWMTGMERNSDLIQISCYAPLLVNVNPGARQWGTNLIGYDALTSFGSPSYYAQAMFANNRGDVTLPLELTPQPQAQPAAPPPAPTGGVGVGTWLTTAEYRDIKVTSGNSTLYDSKLNEGTAGWRMVRGNWSAVEGALRQTGSDETDCRAEVGSRTWTDYTLTLRARKISGAEGFLVMFHVQNRNNYLWWNIGGWGNTRSAIEKAVDGSKHEVGQAADVRVETGRWYNVRVEVEGSRVRCYLDDKLITQTQDRPGSASVDPLYAAASRDLKTGDVIAKVVNVSAAPQAIAIDLQGAGRVTGGTTEVIAGEPSDVNSVENPVKVAPVKRALETTSNQFIHVFPPHSVTILRVRAKER